MRHAIERARRAAIGPSSCRRLRPTTAGFGFTRRAPARSGCPDLMRANGCSRRARARCARRRARARVRNGAANGNLASAIAASLPGNDATPASRAA